MVARRAARADVRADGRVRGREPGFDPRSCSRSSSATSIVRPVSVPIRRADANRRVTHTNTRLSRRSRSRRSTTHDGADALVVEAPVDSIPIRSLSRRRGSAAAGSSVAPDAQPTSTTRPGLTCGAACPLARGGLLERLDGRPVGARLGQRSLLADDRIPMDEPPVLGEPVAVEDVDAGRVVSSRQRSSPPASSVMTPQGRCGASGSPSSTGAMRKSSLQNALRFRRSTLWSGDSLCGGEVWQRLKSGRSRRSGAIRSSR